MRTFRIVDCGGMFVNGLAFSRRMKEGVSNAGYGLCNGWVALQEDRERLR
jgi:hypothetical protein